MTPNNWEILGENIKEIIDNAIDSQDFQKLNQTIHSTMINAVSEIEKNIKLTQEKKKQNDSIKKSQAPQPKQLLYARTTRTQVISILLIVIGFALSSIFGIAFLGILFGTLFFFKDSIMIPLIIIWGILFILFMIIGFIGVRMLSQVKRFQRYVRGIAGTITCSIEQLAYEVHKTTIFVKKDLEKMIDKGWFCEGHIDREGKYLMVTHEVYNEYLKSLSKQPQQEKEMEYVADEVKEVLKTGKAYIDEIHKSNDKILGLEISQKIEKIEIIVQRIFKRIEQHPENIPDIRKFMKYYLPTTIKLLKAYEELDQQPVQGENILRSKEEIENTLDTLNYAFEKLLDDLFRDTAWDVSSDVNVLETLLAQEGLMENKTLKKG